MRRRSVYSTRTGTANAPGRWRFDLLNTYLGNEPGETFCHIQSVSTNVPPGQAWIHATRRRKFGLRDRHSTISSPGSHHGAWALCCCPAHGHEASSAQPEHHSQSGAPPARLPIRLTGLDSRRHPARCYARAVNHRRQACPEECGGRSTEGWGRVRRVSPSTRRAADPIDTGPGRPIRIRNAQNGPMVDIT